jgi:Trp operon repressor
MKTKRKKTDPAPAGVHSIFKTGTPPRTRDANGQPMRTDAELLKMAAAHDEAMIYHRLLEQVESGTATDAERKQLAKLKRTSKEQPGFCPLWFNSEYERERFNRLKETKRAADIAAALDSVANGNDLLTAALSNWVLRTLAKITTALTEDEGTLLAYIITPTGKTKDGRTKHMTQRDIAKRLGVSHTDVMRKERALRKAHPLLAKWLDKDMKVERKPRGTRSRPVTKRKKV